MGNAMGFQAFGQAVGKAVFAADPDGVTFTAQGCDIMGGVGGTAGNVFG